MCCAHIESIEQPAVYENMIVVCQLFLIHIEMTIAENCDMWPQKIEL